MFCIHCGKPVSDDAATCPECGKALPALATPANARQADGHPANDRLDAASPKSRAVLSLLAFILGTLGIHRLYAGRMPSGSVMLALFLLGCIGSFYGVGIFFVLPANVWALIDFILALIGRFKDGSGKLIKNW